MHFEVAVPRRLEGDSFLRQRFVGDPKPDPEAHAQRDPWDWYSRWLAHNPMPFEVIAD